MRQAGVLAAAGLIAFNEMPDVLSDDHRRAKELAQGCSDMGFELDLDKVKTNMVIVELKEPEKMSALLKDEGVLANRFGAGRLRMVTHYDIQDKDIDYTLEKLKKIKKAISV